MIGRIRYSPGRGGPEGEKRSIGPLVILEVTAHPAGESDWRRQRGLRQLERRLRRWGVHRVIFCASPPEREELSGWARVDVLPFYRDIADLFALEALRCAGIARGAGVVALSGGRVSPELARAAERLVPVVRGVAIDVPGEGAAYAAWLHRRFGIAVRCAEQADAAVALGPGGRRGRDAVCLYEGGVELRGLRVRAEGFAPADSGDQGLLAALWECGGLSRKSLRLEGGNPLTNQDKANIIP